MPSLSLVQWLLAVAGALGMGISKSGFPGMSLVHVVVFALIFGARNSTGIILPMLIAADAPKVEVGKPAPAFTLKDQSGKVINIADLTKQGPVLVRLTCGCSGCDKELAYFQEIDAAYKQAGLTSVAIFK